MIPSFESFPHHGYLRVFSSHFRNELIHSSKIYFNLFLTFCNVLTHSSKIYFNLFLTGK